MDSVYRGWAGRRGGEPKAYYTLRSYFVFIEVHEQPQFTCKAEMFADSSLTPSVAYLRGTVYSKINCNEFTRLQK